MTDPIHIVTSFDGIGGMAAHASGLAKLLSPSTPSQLWSVQASQAAAHYRAQIISPFAGQMPRGGTLVLVGTHFEPGIWLDYVRPGRLIVIATMLRSTAQTMAFLALLERPSLPKVELAFTSSAARDAMALPGRLCPPLIDLDKFHPAGHIQSEQFRVGRHSRDEAIAHHRDDPSLYKLLGWNGMRVRLMGATILKPLLAGSPNLEILAAGDETPEAFLGKLDLFLYRTANGFCEAGGTAIMQAMACGLPVVAHRSCNHNEWIKPGDNGYLFETQEEACEQVLKLSRSPGTGEALRAAARQTAERVCGREAVGEYRNWIANRI